MESMPYDVISWSWVSINIDIATGCVCEVLWHCHTYLVVIIYDRETSNASLMAQGMLFGVVWVACDKP